MAALQQYKCPCCGGGIEFDAGSQNVKCPFCGTEFEVDTLISYASEIDSQQQDDIQWQSQPEQVWQEGEGEYEGLVTYICNSCGGEVVGDQNTAATSCPFCGNPVIVSGKLSGSLKPDYVIPFKMNKEQAKQALRDYYKGKKFLPKAFKDENHIDEIKGIYVPFWLFDADANADVRYKATTVRSWTTGDKIFTETSYYSVTRGGVISFERVPVDGSSKIDNNLMEAIEPYDFSEAVDFHTAYLSGFLADKYDEDSTQTVERANQRIKKTTEDAFASTVTGYVSVIPEHSSVQMDNGVAKYALYPVWMLNTTWGGQKYTFAMNGQTGKLRGDLPLDKGAYRKWLFLLTLIIGAAVMGLTFLFWLL